jgi:glycosyltransferase involved in cell wall biosynthesis
MLKGEDGRQTGELDAMLKWIAPNIKPDVIHISTALLSGMAKRLKRLFNVPVISFFQDEDTWIDAMDANSKEDAWDIIEKKAADIDAFVFPSEFYRKKMTSRIGIPEHKQHVVYNGLDPSLYERSKHPASGKFIVGFLSRICRENGLEFLVDAFIEMKKENMMDNVELAITGGHTGNDMLYMKLIARKIKNNKLESKIRFIEKFDLNSRRRFFNDIDLLSVPGCGHAFGLYQVEAFFSGVPVMQPDCGAFREIIDLTKAGFYYRCNDVKSFIDKLQLVINSDDIKSVDMDKALSSAKTFFDIDVIADKFTSLYESLQSAYNQQ